MKKRGNPFYRRRARSKMIERKKTRDWAGGEHVDIREAVKKLPKLEVKPKDE